MDVSKKIVINNQEYDLPEGFEPIGDEGLYLVPWRLIEIAEELKDKDGKVKDKEIKDDKDKDKDKEGEDGEKIKDKDDKGKEFRFFNPRHLGEYKVDHDDDNFEVFHGQGFSKNEMRELMTDMKQSGQAYPLQGYFVHMQPRIDDGGKQDGDPDNKSEKGVGVRVHDGERRYRCIGKMRKDNADVYCRRHKNFMPAIQVYGKVLVQVECMTEEEAFMRAFAISETNIKWGDGANARTVKALYNRGFKDEQICKLLNKSKPWLAETCSLNELDEYCFNFLLANQMNRKVALDLVKIKDVAVRQAWLRGAWKDALETHAKLQAKNEKLLEKAEANEELAQAEVEEAKAKGESPETVAELEADAAVAGEKTKKRQQIKAASAKPMVKSKNLRKASGFLNALRPPKIKKQAEAVQEMIEKNDTSLVSLDKLEVVKVVYQCILDGEDDINNVLKKIA